MTATIKNMRRLLVIPFLFLMAGCSPEFGVSEEGIEECLDRSNETQNKFTAQKTYKRCLTKIEKERRERKLEQERIALRKKKNKEKERPRLVEKYKDVVLKTKKEFIEAGWEEITFSDDYWFLAIDKKEISDATTAMILYYLPRTEEPVFSPKTYFDYRYGPTVRGRATNYKNDPDRWWIFECDNKRFIHAPEKNEIKEIYFTKLINNIVYSSGTDNDFSIKKALRFLDESKDWRYPIKGTIGKAIFNYACPNNKI